MIMVMDFFFSEVKGGAELNAESLIDRFKENGINIQKVKSKSLTVDFLSKNKDKKFIFSNFVLVSDHCKKYAIENLEYAIYEQDHKYLATRNPIKYVNFVAPDSHLTNIDFYKNARVVYFLTKLARDIFVKNTGLTNVCNLGSSVWRKEELRYLRTLSDSEKTKSNAIMDSDNPIKRRARCIKYCEDNGLEYELIKDNDFKKFMLKMSKFKKLIFFTGHLETCARILVEAKMLNLKVIFPKRLVGAASEEWFELSGNDLIDKMEEISSAMPHNVLDHFENPRSMWDDIPVADRKDFYKDISSGSSLRVKTSIFKDIYKGLECVLFSAGPSTSEFPMEKLVDFCEGKPVFSVKTAAIKFKDITDICITNYYATFHFPEERDYLVFARQEMPLGHKNWVNPNLIEKNTFSESFENEPDILWGSDVTARHSKSVVMANRWEENSLENSHRDRILGPGIMNDMMVPILVHCGISKVSFLGWDGAKINENGNIKHFYDLEPEYRPTLNYVSEDFNLKNLKSDLDECEQEIGKRGEEQVFKYLSEKGIEVEILTDKSSVFSGIKRNLVLYGK